MPRTPKWTNKTRNMTDGILVCNFLIFVDYLFCPLPPKYKHFNCYLWLGPLKNQVWHVFAYISMHSVAEKGSMIATYMLCGRVLYRILHICLSRFVPMYIKHENAKYFCSVVSIILKANLWMYLCTELKLSPRFNQRHMADRLHLSKVAIEKASVWANVLMLLIVNACYVTFPLPDMCASPNWCLHPSP